MKSITLLFVCLFFLSASYTVHAAEDTSLTLSIEAIEGNEGEIFYTVFESKKGFPNKADLAVKRGALVIEDGKASVTINDLPEGTYAISVYHDMDNNGKLKTNFIGMPKEGVGNSNDNAGRPNFEKSSFSLSGNQTVVINMYYP